MNSTDMKALLRWYRAMGVDEFSAARSVNHRLSAQALPQEASAPMPSLSFSKRDLSMPPRAATPKGASHLTNVAEAKAHATRLAEAANTREELKQAVEEFDAIGLTKTAMHTVFSDGNPKAPVMLIGEAPGADEDAKGIPFCGASGQLLDQMLSYIGLMRAENCYITNTIFWRPPGNRRPTPEELAICAPFVEKHIALIAPKLLILVGGTAIAALHDTREGISKIRGTFFEYRNRYLSTPIATTAIFHPSYLLRSPGQKKIAWHDLLTIEQRVRGF